MALKKLAMAAALAIGALALAGCNTDQTAADEAATIASVIKAVKTGCSYVAPASEVASIVATFVGGVATVNLVGQVAGAICNAVSKSGAGVAPSVNGVALHGHFISGSRRRH